MLKKIVVMISFSLTSMHASQEAILAILTPENEQQEQVLDAMQHVKKRNRDLRWRNSVYQSFSDGDLQREYQVNAEHLIELNTRAKKVAEEKSSAVRFQTILGCCSGCLGLLSFSLDNDPLKATGLCVGGAFLVRDARQKNKSFTMQSINYDRNEIQTNQEIIQRILIKERKQKIE